jgi:SAM-dependent MidA family methyltransferase
LQTGNPALIEFIRNRIRLRGPVSFAWFMEQSLYHPEHGYYSSGRAGIGRRGDYFTNVSVGPVFGQLLAAQFAEIWEKLGRVSNFTIVEQGAHHGEFARDVLESIQQGAPELFAAMRYRIVESFAKLRDRQSQTLGEFRNKIDWRESIEALEPFEGLYVANELIDAFPVHLIKIGSHKAMTEGSWVETCVDLDGNHFVFSEQPIADEKLRDFVKKLPSPKGAYETEVNIAALAWIENLSAKLARGYLLSIDYGFSRADFFAEHRNQGTLQCRAQHRLLDSPFAAVGESDITAHVEWTSLAEKAEAGGLHVTGFADQHHFLTGIISESPRIAEEASPKTRRALQTLLHPEMLGRSFQVLVLSKGIDPEIKLRGFKFARDPRVALGLG